MLQQRQKCTRTNIIFTLGIIAAVINFTGIHAAAAAATNTEPADKLDNCAELASAGKCDTDITNMKENCLLTCRDWTERESKSKVIPLQKMTTSFYDLSATRASTKSIINFERFEGYITLIIPLAKVCSNNSVSPKIIFDMIQGLKDVYSYSVEILVFPYDHPDVNIDNQSGLDCTEFETLMMEKDRSIYVMENSILTMRNENTDVDDEDDDDYNDDDNNEEKKEVHPVFQYFLNAMNVDHLKLDTQTYFIIHPDGNRAYYHYEKSLLDMKDVLRELVKTLDPEL